jgi:threonine/homoserine/homoserine lactone efflux protein
MNAGSGLLFAMALAAAAAMPGPSTAAAVARVLARGLGGAARLCIGLVLGELFWLSCAILGMAALAERHQHLFVAIRYAGVAYLLWLAWKLWHAPPAAAAAGDRDDARLPFAGLAIALGNPKTMLFYVALLPGIVRLDDLPLRDALILGALGVCVVAGVLAAYVLAAERLRRHLHSPVALRRIGRGSALLMTAAAGAIVSR